MLLAREPFHQVVFPVEATPWMKLSRMRGVAALRQTGSDVDISFVDAKGQPISEKSASALRALVEDEILELRKGKRGEHAQKTLSDLQTPARTESEDVDALLQAVYLAHAQGKRAKALLREFLDTFEKFLNPAGTTRADMVFERLDLDRAPESMGILLLAVTRLTRDHFKQRERFLHRLGCWLTGRAGRTSQDVENMLRGLRE